MADITQWLDAVSAGDRQATAKILPLVYDELRKLAAARLAFESSGNTLQPTALVHEAYLRLVGPADTAKWENRGHFFAAAAEAMRRILIESARRKKREKHGGEFKKVALDDYPAPDADDRLLALDEALTQLAVEDPLAAKIVELRQFAGLGHEEIAEALDLTVYLARQKWTYARAWLRQKIDE